MRGNLELIKFNPIYEKSWDKFIRNSVNGTFLQTRNFLNYHCTDRFKDCSLMVMKGNEIIAVLPANCVESEGTMALIGHEGSSFGGLVISENSLKVSILEEIFSLLDDFFLQNRFSSVTLKQPGRIYCKRDVDLLEYFFYSKGYETRYEVGYYIDSSCYDNDIISNLSSSRRRDYRYSLKNQFSFREFFLKEEIGLFYEILLDNYKKFNKHPVHKLDELIEFHESRLMDLVRFFGVYYDRKMIAGAMVFCFDMDVFHTQYLAVSREYSDLFANEYLYVSLIQVALSEKFHYISFGTSTLDSGRILNYHLAQYKEGFGTKQYNNKTFVKLF